MRSKRLSTRKDFIEEKDGEDVAANQLGGAVKLADLIWVKINGSSWWPAQVVDDKNVSRHNKPRKRSAEQVLVRLYGSYKYLYVDPLKRRSDFDVILKQNNGCYREILLKALERDVSCSKSGSSKNQGSKSKEALAKSEEVITRKLRVMQHLGLVAPSGSPFHKNGII